MKPRLSVLALGVEDLDRSLAFLATSKTPGEVLWEIVWNPAALPADGEGGGHD